MIRAGGDCHENGQFYDQGSIGASGCIPVGGFQADYESLSRQQHWEIPQLEQHLADEQNRFQETVQDVLRQHFAPEFINRLDETIVFNRLRREDLGPIVRIQIRQINGQIRESGIAIKVSEDAVELLAELGWAPAFGALPLKRTIQKLLMDPLSMKILEGEIHPLCIVNVTAPNGELVFSAEPVETLPDFEE